MANGDTVVPKEVNGPVSPSGSLAFGMHGYKAHGVIGVEPNGRERMQGSRGRWTPIVQDDCRASHGSRCRDNDHRPGTSSEHLEKAPDHRASRSDGDLRGSTDQDEVTALRLQADLFPKRAGSLQEGARDFGLRAPALELAQHLLDGPTGVLEKNGVAASLEVTAANR